MIRIENLSKQYKGTTVLEAFDQDFVPGKIYGIVGRNGSGKTVLMKMICGFVPATTGEVIVDGKRIGKEIDFLPDAGVIIETPQFQSLLSGYRNLADLAGIRKVIGKDQIMQAMEKVGLDPNSKKHVGKYSLGMRQRLGIAQAIMEDASILVLDEPMNGLDQEAVDDIRKLLLEYKDQGKTIILSSHHQEDIDQLCDETIRLEKGKRVVEDK